MPSIRNLLFSFTVLLISFTGSAWGADFYKLVDANGVVHFSDSITEEPEKASLHFDQRDAGTGIATSTEACVFRSPLSEKSINSISKGIDSTFSIKGDHNIGSGFFISPKGIAITCRHVIEGDSSHVAVLNDGNEYPIGVISLNEDHDLALIMVMVHGETPFISVGDPFTMTPGDRIFALGNSLGLQSTITFGIFTGVMEYAARNENVVQFSAPITSGNSGGPLVDEDGRAIGVVSWKIVSRDGMPVNGVGFAVPSGYLAGEYGYYLD